MLLKARAPNSPKNPPTRPPIKAPRTGIGIKVWPIVAPTKLDPIEVADPIVMFLNYLNLRSLLAYWFEKM